MNILTYTFKPLDVNMYIIIGLNSAIIIDPHVDENALTFLQRNNIKNIYIILTHEHIDHISGVNWWIERLSACVICSDICAKRIQNPKTNVSKYFYSLCLYKSIEEQNLLKKYFSCDYTCEANIIFTDKLFLNWENHKLEMIKTPGHSPGSICIILDDKYLFTGDTILGNKKTITRLPGGSRKNLQASIESFFKNIKKSYLVYPGHGTSFNYVDINLNIL